MSATDGKPNRVGGNVSKSGGRTVVAGAPLDMWAPGEGVSIWDERAVHERHLSQSSVAKWWENGYCARHSASFNTVVRDSQLSTDPLTQPLSPFVPKHKAREGKGMLRTDI